MKWFLIKLKVVQQLVRKEKLNQVASGYFFFSGHSGLRNCGSVKVFVTDGGRMVRIGGL